MAPPLPIEPLSATTFKILASLPFNSSPCKDTNDPLARDVVLMSTTASASQLRTPLHVLMISSNLPDACILPFVLPP